jgi:hypothetical protein
MRKYFGFGLTVLAALVIQANAQDQVPLRLVQTIPIPKVQGRFDHIDVDVEGKRLFVAAVGPGAGTSLWLPQSNRFYVAVPAHEKQQAAILVFEPEP